MTQIEEILNRFDEKFGKKSSDDLQEQSIGKLAGCDDCYVNQKNREEQRTFFQSELTTLIEKQRTEIEGLKKPNPKIGLPLFVPPIWNDALDQVLSLKSLQK